MFCLTITNIFYWTGPVHRHSQFHPNDSGGSKGSVGDDSHSGLHAGRQTTDCNKVWFITTIALVNCTQANAVSSIIMCQFVFNNMFYKNKTIWRSRGSNPGPFTCKANALPLRYIPLYKQKYLYTQKLSIFFLCVACYKGSCVFRHLLPKQLLLHGLDTKMVQVTEDAILSIGNELHSRLNIIST